ncbi:MAG: hypothetical protein DDT26_00789 [Dehalococcoidia bacterium]|nr:hypothetical protein [Chloroflexota bacterium]
MAQAIGILNKDALADARSKAAGAVHALTLAHIHGRPVKDALDAVDFWIDQLSVAKRTVLYELSLLDKSVNLLTELRNAGDPKNVDSTP